VKPSQILIENLSVHLQRDNIVFGCEWDEDRYWRAVENAELLPDLELLPDGDLTEIGEKGISELPASSPWSGFVVTFALRRPLWRAEATCEPKTTT
jgi:hypothetical protein